MKEFFKFILGKFAPKVLCSILYRYKTGAWIDWRNPTDINEKINWMKFNSDTSMWTILSDKYRVRKYIEDIGCSNYLVKLYGMWDKAEDIDFEKLPKSFVLKCNNGSGTVLVVKDKTKLNIDKVRQTAKAWLKLQWGYSSAEPHYTKIENCIIAEEYLEETSNSFSSSIVDYKIWCFNGKPHSIWVAFNRTAEAAYVANYDLEWNYRPEWGKVTPHYKDGGNLVPKPENLDELLDVASKLSQGFPQVRLDLYDIDGKIYFGEYTFTNCGGYILFYTKEHLLELGKQVNII